MSARSESSNTNLAGFLFFFLGGILNTLQALAAMVDAGMGSHAVAVRVRVFLIKKPYSSKARRTAQERVTG